jgi:hypothetical protein
MADHGRDVDEVLGRAVVAAGVTGMVVGAAAWATARAQLADERIVVPATAEHLPGRAVRGPLTALAEAAMIKRAALGATGGRTYGELEEDDPAADTALHASLLRASLFTSVLAFATAASQAATGAVLVAVGAALRRRAAERW